MERHGSTIPDAGNARLSLGDVFDKYRGSFYTPVSYTHLDVYKRQVLLVIDKQRKSCRGGVEKMKK